VQGGLGQRACLEECRAAGPGYGLSCAAWRRRKKEEEAGGRQPGGEIDGVEQLTRYLEYLNRDGNLRPVSGIYAAQEIKPQARVLAEDRGIRCLTIDYDELRGIESDELKLF
jgi:hypothetical protein